MGSGCSTASSRRRDGDRCDKLKGRGSITSETSRLSQGISTDDHTPLSTQPPGAATVSTTRRVDRTLVTASDAPHMTLDRKQLGATSQLSDTVHVVPSAPNWRYTCSKHSMVFEDEGGVPDNVDARVHRAFSLDMRTALKGKDAFVTEVHHRLDNGILTILYRVKHGTKMSPAAIGALADSAEMTATWQTLDLYRKEALSRCSSDTSMRRASSSNLNRHLSASVSGTRLSSPTRAEESDGVPHSQNPRTRLSHSGTSTTTAEVDAPTFYDQYVEALDGEQRRGSIATESTKKPRPAPADTDHYVQQLHTATRLRSNTAGFLDEGREPRQPLRTCHGYALPLPLSEPTTGSSRLTSPLLNEECGRQRFGSIATAGDDAVRSSASTLNIASEGSMMSSMKDVGVKPAPPILVTNSSFRLDSSASSLPRWQDSQRFVKLRLARKPSVSFLLKEAPPPAYGEGRPYQDGVNSVSHNLWSASATSNRDKSVSLLSGYMFPS